MKAYRLNGTITVFLSLISVLFLSLLCTMVESARIQGCRAKAAAALDMGMFSVFGEFENEMLETYDIFVLDGACGTGNYSTAMLKEKLTDYMEYNVDPNRGLLLKGFDPFGLTLKDCRITGVQLATDENGEAFYQQAVRFMKENLGTEVISGLIERVRAAEQMEEAGEFYENQDHAIAERIEEIKKEQERQEEEKQREWEEQRARALERGEILPEERPITETEEPMLPAEKNPLEVIKKLKKRGLMGLVLGNQTLSEKSLSGNIPSKRTRKKGTLPVKKENTGLMADLLFQEYLFGRFCLFTDEEKEGVLDYELEYMLCGKNSDAQNLKSVVTRLLLMREGANFLYLMNDPVKKQEADACALLLTSWIPIPGIQGAFSYALLLAWAYGESLLDVRELLAGGKVPLLKDESQFRLSLNRIPELVEILDETDGSAQEGLSYEGYLQILYALGNRNKYPMRALDLMEGYLRRQPETANFRADHAITKMKAEASYEIPPVFMKVSHAFLGTGVRTQDYRMEGSFAY